MHPSSYRPNEFAVRCVCPMQPPGRVPYSIGMAAGGVSRNRGVGMISASLQIMGTLVYINLCVIEPVCV